MGKIFELDSPGLSGSLKDQITAKFVEKRSQPPLTEKGYVRASGFAMLCPREEVIAALHNIFREETFDAKSMLNFALGTGMHRALQDEILPASGTMYGEWACLECGKHYGGPTKQERKKNPLAFNETQMILRPDACTKCGDKAEFRYVEQFFTNEEYRITGHPDGFIRVPGREGLGVFEAKSIGQRGAWEVRKVPKFEHVLQAQIYLWFTGLKWSCLFYWDKGTFGTDGLIEHYVDRDEDSIDAIKHGLKSIFDGIRTKSLPDRICHSADAPRAIKCACRKPCFAPESK